MAYLIMKQSKRVMLFLIAALVAAVPAGCGTTKASMQPEASYQDAETAPDSALISDIRVLEKDQGTIVEISGDRRLTFTSVKQSDPSGVHLFFPNTWLDADTSQLAVAGVVSGIESAELATDKATVRVAIHLTEDCTYTVNNDGNRLEVIFPSTETAAVTSESEPVTQAAAEPSEPSPEMEAPAATMVSDISADNEETYTDIRILADGTITDYSTFELTNPPRIVYDLKNVQGAGANTSEQTVEINNGSIDQVRYFTHTDKIRLVIDATSDHLTHNAIATEDGLSIKVENGLKAAAKAPVYIAQANQASDAIETPAAGPIGLVNQIDFDGETDGKSTITIGATETPDYTLEKVGDTKLKLTLFRTKLPDYRERPFITTSFESAVDRILPYTQESTPNQTFFTIELRESVPYYVEQQGKRLMVHFEASSVPAKDPAAELTLADQRVTVSQSTSAPKTTAVSQTAPQATAASTATQATAEPEEAEVVAAAPKYTGEKISLELYESDIKTIFRILQDVSGMNFAIDKDVSGSVTLSIENAPWDQILDLVLKMEQLGKTMEGNIVRIATQDTLKKEESARQEAILAEQKSKEQALALEPLRTEYIPVNYSSAGSEVLPHIENILSEGRGHAEVDERSNLIVITDTDRVIKQAKSIVEQLDKVTPQVMIEARVVEVSANFSHELGISWDLAQEGVVKNMLGGSYDWDMAMNYPSSDTDGSVGFSFSRVAGTPLVIDATLNAMQSQGQGKIVSAPKILTKDNITASIKQGYEVGYTERDDSGGSSIAFKSVDLLLEVTPHVTPDSRVSMTVHITKNDIGDEYNDMPLVDTNEANTEFLVENGETVVIGGILKTTENTSEKGFPILKDIPGLGLLFGNQSESTVSKELLIFITPKIVTLTQKSVE